MPNSICSIDDCERPSWSRSLCNTHYSQQRRRGELAVTPRLKGIHPCSVDGCEERQVSKTYCAKHYGRFHRYGDPLDDRTRVRKPCSVEGCERLAAARGLCQPHWARQREGRELGGAVRERIVTNDLAKRLAHYAPEGSPDACWEWTGARNKNYGMIAVPGSRLRGAHIVAWELDNGRALPDGMLIRHTCDNPPCVNPTHLLLGDHATNMQDKSQRGRWGAPRPSFRHRTPEEVREIRRLADLPEANLTAIARQFGCSRATVIRIKQRDVFDTL